jgi:peptidyl-prolyl cis-trans isomerase D
MIKLAKGAIPPMLGIMRKYKESIIIKIVFAIIVLSFVGTIFLVWGRGDKTSGSADYAAKVDRTRISLDDYQKAYYRMRSIYEQIYGRSMTPEMEKQANIKKLAIDSLIDKLIVEKEAGRMGIKVSKKELEEAIAAIPAFQKDGAFNFQQYQQTLKSNRMTPKEFEAAQEEELLVKKAKQQIKDKATVSDDEALQHYKKQHDKVDLQFVSFSPAEVKGSIRLTEQDLNSYLQAHQDRFKTPEQVSVSYCIVDPAKVAAKLAVSDDEAQAFYQKNIDRYQNKGEILPFAQVKERARADALRAKGAKEAYEQAADALNKHVKTADIAAAAAGLGTKVEQTPLFTAMAPAAALAGETEIVKRAFTLKQGELGGPIETSRGIYLIKVKEKQASAVPPLAQIKARVEVLALEDKAREVAKKKAEEAVAKGDIKGQDSGPFAYSAAGDIPKIGKSPEIMEAAFALTSEAPAPKTPYKIGDRWFAIKLKNRIAGDTAEFQKTKEEIKKSLLPKKQQEALDTWLKDLKAKAKIEINQALLAE